MFLKYNYPGLAWAALILVLCGLPGSQFQSSHVEGADVVIHAFLFCILFLLLAIGFIKQSSISFLRRRTLIKVFLIAVAYGLVVELLQGFVFIDRSVEGSDILANMLGALVGWGGFLLIYGTESYT